MASCSGDIDTASSQLKTSLLSLPDEVLEHIVELLAGEARFTPMESHKRDGINDGDLYRLRLVNKRLSRIVDLELYRAPNALARTTRPLTGDDLDVLLHPKVAQFSQMLSVAGTAPFCAGLLESRFCRLTSLSLGFAGPQLVGNDGRVVAQNKALSRLRRIVQALPLRELDISSQHDVVKSQYDLYQIALLGAGHSCLRKLTIHAQRDLRLAPAAPHQESLIRQSNLTSPIRTLAVRCFTADHAQVVRNALGSLTQLAELVLRVDDHVGGEDSCITQTLKVLTSGIEHRIVRLEILATEVGPRIWKVLAGLPSLEVLRLDTIETDLRDQFPDVCFPKLAHISIHNWNISSTNVFVFMQAADRTVLPSLRTIDVSYEVPDFGYDSHHIDRIRMMVDVYDELVERRKDITITPLAFREKAIQRMQALQASTED